jgi:integrase
MRQRDRGATRYTLARFVAEVWAPRANRRLAAKTRKRDTAIYRKHILPALGERPIDRMEAEDLVEWQDELELAGVGGPTIVKAISLLSSIFREAARRSRSTGVTGNPAALLDRPSAKRRRRPLVWGPVVVERVRHELLVGSRRIGAGKEQAAFRDALLVSCMEMAGCRPGETLALRWCDFEDGVVIARALSGDEIRDGTKTARERRAPLLNPLRADLTVLRDAVGDGAEDYVFRTPRGGHWVETDWRNYRCRHFVRALERVEAGWAEWRESLADPDQIRESVRGLVHTRPYDLGRHTHSALMLASGMSLQRLARIQGHSIRVLDEAYSEEIAEFQERAGRIDPTEEIEAARRLVWGSADPSTGT